MSYSGSPLTINPGASGTLTGNQAPGRSRIPVPMMCDTPDLQVDRR
jgi:hypothetical protein